jgi:hypothetical protein
MMVLHFLLARSASADSPPAATSDAPAATTVPAPAPRPERLAFDPYKPVPTGYHVESTPSLWFMVPGTIIFGLPYAGSVLSGATSRCVNNRWMLLPVAGPFVTAARYDHNHEGACDDPEGIAQGVAWMDGLAQGLGALLLAGGVLFPSHDLVRDESPGNGTQSRATATRVNWHLGAAALGKTGAAFGVWGTF